MKCVPYMSENAYIKLTPWLVKGASQQSNK